MEPRLLMDPGTNRSKRVPRFTLGLEQATPETPEGLA